MDQQNNNKDWVDELLDDIRSEQEAESAAHADPPAEEPPTGTFIAQSTPPAQKPTVPRKKTATPSKGTSSVKQASRPMNTNTPKSHKRKKKKTVRVGIGQSILYVAISLAVCAVAAVFCLRAVGDVLAVSRPDKAVQVTIPADATAKEIGEIFKENGLIEYPWMFAIVAKYENMGEVAEGTYVLNTNMGYTSLMHAIEKSEQPAKTVTVTIPEGLTLSQVAALMEENNVCSANDFLNSLENTDFDYAFIDDIPNDPLLFRKLEGYLFPDTYEFYENDNALNVIQKMMDNFTRKVTNSMIAQAEEQGMTLHELLTLASIIQAEAPDEENMVLVSSVYHNRLNNPSEYPKLQADPTRKYASEEIESELGIEGQKIADAYNTYEGNGLPPGPINNPGLAAINAALNPAETNYYYFCSNLKTKQFYYAETLAEHEQNLAKANLK